MILLIVAIVIIVVLLFRIRREGYVDFRTTRDEVLDILDEAYENKGFTEEHIKKIKEKLEPIMRNDKKIFDTVMEYVNQDRFDDVNDIVDIYFNPLI
jgi:CHASE3 domain sensor protein